jgi:hypothetical protein
MALSDALDFGNLRNVHSSSMSAMALAVGNQPVRLIISTAALKRYFVTNIPIFSGDHLHIAEVASAAVAHENVHPHFCGYAFTCH